MRRGSLALPISGSISKKARARGFTIVELLVVIVTIAILASIVVVAYNGTQDKANDSAVKSDLRGIADKIEAFRAGSSARQYPAATQAELQAIIQVSKGSYSDGNASGSMSYCRNDTDFTVLGRSKSKNAFVISSQGGLKQVTFSGNINDQCALGGVASGSTGFGSVWLLKGTANPEGAGWQSWIP